MNAEMKLEIVKKNYYEFINYLDNNRMMESISDEAWKYLLAIEKVVESEN